MAVTVGMVAMRAEGVDMIEVSVRTRAGCLMASAWAIMPPIEVPMTCADGQPRASITARASAAMSSSRYGAADGRNIVLSQPGAGVPVRWVDSPVSRLSNLAARKPRPARAAQKSSGQISICAPVPLISSSGTPSGGPNVS